MKLLTLSKQICGVLLAVLCVQVAVAASDPVKMLQGVADQLIAKLKENQTTLSQNPNLVYSLANEIVVPHAAIGEMSKRVLPPQTWNGATASQKEQFEKQFTTLLVRTYASALAQYNDQTVHFMPLRGAVDGKTNIQVQSRIDRTDGPSISVNYRLMLVGSEWKLYDLIVEGVSLVDSFRSQFADQLSQGGNMDSILKNLVAHNSQTNGG